MKVAALDLGTNTFLCLIAEGTAADGITSVHRDLAQVVRLGQGVAENGSFHPEALKRAKDCLVEFKKVIDQYDVDQVLAMATSAARDAKNASELFKIAEDLKIPLKIIPGADEARITYQGAMSGSQKNSQQAPPVSVIIDIGGGSTELITGQGQKILFSRSLDMGGVRLTEKMITRQPVPEAERFFLQEHIQAQLAPVLKEFLKHKIDRAIAVAGTPTALASIEFGGFDESKIDGHFISQVDLKKWVDVFSSTSVEEKRQKYNLGGRADIIYAGSLILWHVLEGLKLPGFYVSTKGVRYGVALEMLSSSAF